MDLKNYFDNNFDEIKNIDKKISLFYSSIDYSISAFDKQNICLFFDYFYEVNKSLFDLHEFVSFVQQENHFFSNEDSEIASETLNLIFQTIDVAYNREDFNIFVKSLTVKNKNEEYFKKLYLDFFDGLKLSKKLQNEKFNMEINLSYYFSEYINNVENISYIQENSINDDIIEKLCNDEIDLYFIKKNGKYFLKPSFNNLKLIKSSCSNSELRNIACKLLSKEGKYFEKESNLSLAKKIINIRESMAALFNKKSYIEYAVENNLLNHPEKINAFIETVHNQNYTKALDEIIELRDYVKEKFNVDNLTYQDLYYYSACYKTENLKDNLVNYKKYFLLDNVKERIFELYYEIFDLSFEKIENELFSDIDNIDVYKVFYKKEFKTYLVLDLIERNNKPEDGYVSPLKRCYDNVAGILLVNLSISENKEMDTDDISRLLHELGHIAESVLYGGKYTFDDLFALYEKDACEVISSTMELYATDKDFLKKCVSNNENLEMLSDEDILSVLDTDSFLKSMDTIYLLACAEYDFLIHNKYKGDIELLHVDIFNKRSPLFDELGENLVYNFSHAFDGFYSGNYYCYLLAEVLAKELFEAINNDKSKMKLFKYKIASRQDGIKLIDNLKVFYDNELPKNLAFLEK